VMCKKWRNNIYKNWHSAPFCSHPCHRISYTQNI